MSYIDTIEGEFFMMKYTVIIGNDKATGTTPSVVGKK